MASIKEIGVIEPLVVYPQSGKGGNYSLLDGQVRFEVLKARGDREVLCLIATEDEA